MKQFYNKWIPRLLFIAPDGGKDSGVQAFFIIEWKAVFSIAILRFNKGSREAYHNHAFHALTWWLKGKVTEQKITGELKEYTPSFIPKFTSRSNFHKVNAHKTTYALTIRGPWKDTWEEYRKGMLITLTHGRKEI
jgi:hypothetical protein